jgi:hypothetical protein
VLRQFTAAQSGVRFGTGGKIGFFVRFSSGWKGSWTLSQQALQLSTWYHIAGVWDGAVMKVYINGVVEPNTSPASGTITPTTNAVYLGQDFESASERFNGTVDELKVYNYALTSDTIRVHSRIVATIPYIPNPTYNRRPQLRWYRNDSIPVFRIQIDTTQLFTSPIVSQSVADTFFSPTTDLPYDTIYWRVRNDADTLWWSTVSSVRIIGYTPTLIAYTPNPTYNRRPVLQWHKHDSIPLFRIQIDTINQFISPMISTTTTDTFYTPVADLPYDTMYWRVGNEADPRAWSTVSPVRIIRSVPTLIAYSPDPTDNRQPLLTWHPVSGTSLYSIQISTAPDFSSHIATGTVSDTFYTPSLKLPRDTTIYWRVRTDLDTLFSTPDMFTINAPPLLVPIANGNRWTYSYDKKLRNMNGIVNFPPGFFSWSDTVKNGKFQIFISSVSVRNDSTFFTVTTVDSGLMITSNGSGWDSTITSAGYNTSSAFNFMIFDSALSREYPAGVWSINNPWYLSYRLRPDMDSMKTNPSSPPYYFFQYSWKRNTGISDTTINSHIHVLYATDSQYYYHENIQAVHNPEITQSRNDTVKWIKDFGAPYREVNNFYHYEIYYYGEADRRQTTEHWTLTSFTVATTPVSRPLSLKRGIPDVFSITGSSGTVRYALPEQCRVSLKYFDLRGRLVANLVNTVQGAGYYTLSVRHALPSSGTYIRVFEAGSFVKRELTAMVGK